MDLRLTGKRALVTGGSKGIGKAVATRLAEEGCQVVIAARTEATLRDAAAEITNRSGGVVVPVVMDTGDDASVADGVGAAVDAVQRIDILVNSAARPMGQSTPPKLADITSDAFWDDVNVKVMGYIRTARQVAPIMKQAGWGRIVNISGLGARTVGSAIGSARNVAVAAITKNLADELGPHGINVTVVHPGLTRTEATAGVVAARAAAAGVDEDEIERRLAATNSIKRLIDAEEVADIVTFLCSPRSVAINGDAIACGGGQPGAIHY